MCLLSASCCRVGLVGLFSDSSPSIERQLGIETIAGYLRAYFGKKCDIKIYDLQTESSILEVGEAIRDAGLDILGVSIKIGSLIQARELLQVVYKRDSKHSKLPICVLGNVIPTIAAAEILQEYPDAILVAGEGEEAMRSLIVSVLNGNSDSFHDSPNLVFKQGDRIIRTRRATIDLGTLGIPSTDTIRAVLERGGGVWVEASRGCNGHCTFCIRPCSYGIGWRPFPIKKVVDEIDRLVGTFGVGHIRFADEMFIGPPIEQNLERVRGIGKRMAMSNVTFDFATRVDSVYRAEDSTTLRRYKVDTFKYLRDCGLSQVYMGIESGSDSQLKRFGKGTTVEQNTGAIEILRQMGIQVVAGFILLDPLAISSEVKQSIRYIEEMGFMQENTDKVFIANPASYLRVLKSSPYASMLLRENLIKDGRGSLLTYDAYYRDQQLGKIYELMKTWHSAVHSFVYSVKEKLSLLSVAKQDTAEAHALERYIQRMKRLDFQLVKELIENRALISDADRKRTVDHFKRLRIEIIKEMLSMIDAGTVSDANNLLRNNAKRALDYELKGLSCSHPSEDALLT